MLPPIAAILNPKDALREKMRAERAAAARARPDAARHAAANFMARIEIAPGAIVALYHPLKDELDTAPLADALAERAARLALPVTLAKRTPLEFRAYAAGDRLVKGRFGAMTPAAAAPVLRPDIVVVPLLGFTRAGDRLGYGGGYYDRTLAQLRAEGAVVAVGYAYGAQQIDALPAGRHDERLDWIVTEREAIKVREAAGSRLLPTA